MLHALDEPLVWAVDDTYRWLYWFPRDCPRACWTANESTTDEDVERRPDGVRERRVAVIESIYPLWDTVIATTLDDSGVRLRNAARA